MRYFPASNREVSEISTENGKMILLNNVDHTAPSTSSEGLPTYESVSNNNEKPTQNLEKSKIEKSALESISRTQRNNPQFHFTDNGQFYTMQKYFTNSKNIVLECTKKCPAKAKLLRDEKIISRPNIKKKRIVIDTAKKSAFEIR